MAIIFSQKKRSQQIFLLVFVLAAALTAFVFWRGFGKNSKNGNFFPPKPGGEKAAENIKIDFSVLEGKLLKEAKDFPEIQPLGSNASTATGTSRAGQGRENPFLP